MTRLHRSRGLFVQSHSFGCNFFNIDPVVRRTSVRCATVRSGPLRSSPVVLPSFRPSVLPSAGPVRDARLAVNVACQIRIRRVQRRNVDTVREIGNRAGKIRTANADSPWGCYKRKSILRKQASNKENKNITYGASEAQVFVISKMKRFAIKRTLCNTNQKHIFSKLNPRYK